MSESYTKYNIRQFLIESSDGVNFTDLTTSVTAIRYYEDLFSPAIFISIDVANTSGILTRLPNKDKNKRGIRGGERVRLVVDQPATKKSIKLEEDKNTYYIYKVYGSTTQQTKEVFTIELCPAEVFQNETTRVIRKYDGNIKKSVNDILKTVLETTNYKQKNIESTSNSYVFYGNTKRPFTVLTWLCPKSIPVISESSPKKGTAGFLFYQNTEGFNFKSIDSLLGNTSITETYYNTGMPDVPASQSSNFRISNMPVFEKNVNIMENLRIGMYSSKSYFFDINDRKFYEYDYSLKESYDSMKHTSSKNVSPPVPLGLDKNPSRLMVRILDNFNADPADQPTDNPTAAVINKDKTTLYQAASIARYNLAFSQKLNVIVPLNLNLTVGNCIRLKFWQISKEDNKREIDDEKSGNYVIKELVHAFGNQQGWTSLKLIKDSYGAPSE